MTITRGVRILAGPCCGAQYASPRYLSINFSALEDWTDGWREASLMPNDEGLRRCRCGQFILLNGMIELGTAQASELPGLDPVPVALLQTCLTAATDQEVEVAARLGYWRHLNHAYREHYRRHRAAEEAATRAAWEAANPDRRSAWTRWMRRKPPAYLRPAGSPFTAPVFEPSEEQWHNMRRLSDLLAGWDTALGRSYGVELAELYREQSRFDEAESAIKALGERQGDVTGTVVARLIHQRQSAPMRFHK